MSRRRRIGTLAGRFNLLVGYSDHTLSKQTGALAVVWSHGGHISRFHPGWLRAHAWFGDEAEIDGPVLWSASASIKAFPIHC